jgi:hypothetical protein
MGFARIFHMNAIPILGYLFFKISSFFLISGFSYRNSAFSNISMAKAHLLLAGIALPKHKNTLKLLNFTDISAQSEKTKKPA